MFYIHGAVEEARSWTWDEFTALPTEEVTVEIHCVTMWSKLNTRWKDLSVDTLFDGRDGGRLGDRDRRRRPHDEPGLEDVTDGRRGSPTSTTARHPQPSTAGLPAARAAAFTTGRARSGPLRALTSPASSRPRQRGQGPSRLTRR